MGNGAGSRGRIGLHNTQDLTCGLFFMAVALLGMWFGKDLPVGSPTRLGTGVFPRILCWGMLITGGIIFLKGLVTEGEKLGHIAWRPVILVSVAATAFALAIEPLGLVIAMLALIIAAAFAGHEFYPKEVIVYTIIQVVIGVALFVWGLGMPIKTFPWG
jgi:Tripartite tricarboxylate transporter TctB family